jgi:hypothetical protein
MVDSVIANLVASGVPKNRLAILGSVPATGGYGSPPTFRDADSRDGVFAIGRHGSSWFLYSIERGVAYMLEEWPDEASACDAFIRLVRSFVRSDGGYRLPST